jgi:hypothetical protein
LISLAFGGLLALLVGAAGGMILAMTQMRSIVRGEVQAIVDEEVTKVEQDLLWCMSHPDEAACKPAAPAHAACRASSA